MNMPRNRTDRKASTATHALEPTRTENQHLLAFLDELATRPDDKGPTWWEEFRAFLRTAPVRLEPPPIE